MFSWENNVMQYKDSASMDYVRTLPSMSTRLSRAYGTEASRTVAEAPGTDRSHEMACSRAIS